MSSPTPEVVTWILAQDLDWEQTDSQLAAALNGVKVENPVPVSFVLPALSAMVLFQQVGPESRARLGTYNNLREVRQEILSNQRGALCNWIQVLAAASVITSGEAISAITFLNTPSPDPAYASEIAQTAAILGRELTVLDLATARYQRAQDAINARADALQLADPALRRREALERADEELRNG